MRYSAPRRFARAGGVLFALDRLCVKWERQGVRVVRMDRADWRALRILLRNKPHIKYGKDWRP